MVGDLYFAASIFIWMSHKITCGWVGFLVSLLLVSCHRKFMLSCTEKGDLHGILSKGAIQDFGHGHEAEMLLLKRS